MASPTFSRGARDVVGPERVLLLHGLARRAASTARLARALRAAGYETLNADYPSRKQPLEVIAEAICRREAAFLYRPEGRLHMVGHSMGGLLARAVITRRRPAALGRVVMLGAPNGGSEIADRLCRNWLYGRVFGPAGAQLVTFADASFAACLGPLDFEAGVIAGNRSLDPIGYWLLPRPNDGRVSVARTRVAGMTDHIVVRATHAIMPSNPVVVRQTIHFLRHGRFARDGSSVATPITPAACEPPLTPTPP